MTAALARTQRAYDTQLPPEPEYDPVENMTEAEYAAAVMRWLDHGAPHGSTGQGMEFVVRDAVLAFVIAEKAS